ncbi:hypothetical protein J1782_00225 [Rahnella sp. BCC 1045]|uniref:hypothetical protein n=1 Tax=Rahnella sp. BCC 1045 TaxID=2816251 RepID=UPI001C26FEDA|nr:hypothetical protein [Rahnella sp. BCC 1045]MBU9818324.1 hypothetical protein [Rahnella sp. BCC 1045]
MTALDTINEQRSIVDKINEILVIHGLPGEITLSDLTFHGKYVNDLVKGNHKLSDLITNHLWPSINLATVYHYTSRSAAECILNSGIFRLTNIEKRYNEGEIIRFCETHNLTGYLQESSDNTPLYRELIMPNTFYASFTEADIPKDKEEYFWNVFGCHDGVRLKFEIQATNSNFRRVKYEMKAGQPLQPLFDLIEEIKNEYGFIFTMKGISRLCSFYLPGEYSCENEYRLLHRTWDGGDIQPKGNGVQSYIELPLNLMNECGFKLKIIEVQSKEQINMPCNYLFSKREVI